jgi:preprotein translocase subunit SecA
MRSLLTKLFVALSRLHSGAYQVSNSRYEQQVQQINRLGPTVRELSDPDLQHRFKSIRDQIKSGVSFDQVVIEAFAVIKEAARRTLGMQPYDVQLLAGLALNDRKMIEMQTGEGKTLAAVLPACLRAASGRGVHVLTFNDYLAARDAAWMKPIFCFLGLTVGHVAQGMNIADRQAAYHCDVTYVTAKEAGFDFLRDQACLTPDDLVQRDFHFAIVDEADSILIDEARVPLVIAGPTQEKTRDLYQLADIVRTLRPGRDYEVSEGWRNVSFHQGCLDRLQHDLHCGELFSNQNVELLTRLNLALHAQVLLRRDVDYLVREGVIELIDEMTGRVAENRRWPYGLQAALEAKEGIVIHPQGTILNSITLQHFLQLYEGLSGMTGTARDAAEEFKEFYQMTTVVIPPNRPCIRRDLPDRIFPTKNAKYQALIGEITSLHLRGCPVLVGTASVQESEFLAAQLSRAGCQCRVLNAKHDREEAALVAEAGAINAVTISTNMAGRGTDIRLGGSTEQNRERVVELGGLHVFGTNRHESRRIDNQLRGRAGRQGDPGQTQFFISLEDDLIHRHGIGDLVATNSKSASHSEMNNPGVGSQVAHVQRVIEGECFEIRRTLRKYSFCLEQQRRTVHDRRRKLLLKQESPSILSKHDPELLDNLVTRFGPEVIAEAERQVTIWQIDRNWAKHLSHVADIRDQIHLISMGGLNPVDEFNRQVTSAFRDLSARIEQEILDTLRTAHFTPDGIQLDANHITGPSSTWTYMINDNPMGDFVDRLTRKLRHGLKRAMI